MSQKKEKKKLATVIEDYSHTLQTELHGLASLTASFIAEEEANKPHQFHSKKSEVERLEKKIESELEILQRRLANGASHLLKKMISLSYQDKEMFSEQVATDLAKLIKLTTTIAAHQEAFIEQLGQDKSVLAAANVSYATFEKMYAAAKELYKEMLYVEAVEAFSFLTLIHSQSYACWLGLAHAEFYLRNYEQALYAYAFCCHLNPDDPTCHIYSSRCYEETQQIANAINAIDLALFVVDQHSHYEELKPKLEREKQRLTAKQNA